VARRAWPAVARVRRQASQRGVGAMRSARDVASHGQAAPIGACGRLQRSATDALKEGWVTWGRISAPRSERLRPGAGTLRRGQATSGRRRRRECWIDDRPAAAERSDCDRPERNKKCRDVPRVPRVDLLYSAYSRWHGSSKSWGFARCSGGAGDARGPGARPPGLPGAGSACRTAFGPSMKDDTRFTSPGVWRRMCRHCGGKRWPGWWGGPSGR
jgi:hypothetical protein